MSLTLANDNGEVKHLLVSQLLNKRFNCVMDMNAIRRKRLKALIEAEFGLEKGNVAAYGRKYGIAEARLSQLLSDTYRDGKNFGEKAARSIEALIGAPPMSLDQVGDRSSSFTVQQPVTQYGTHPMRRAADFELVSADETELEVGKIEYWDARGSCGGGFLNYDQMPKGHLVKEHTFFQKFGVKPSNAFAIYADGESMANFIVDGDIVIFDKSRTTPQSGKIYAIDHPDGLRIKRLRRGIDGAWVLESDNPDKRAFPDERIEPDQMDLLKIHGEFVYRQGG
jgi:phage repressor protein C with HTH and peptisase S24 domain